MYREIFEYEFIYSIAYYTYTCVHIVNWNYIWYECMLTLWIYVWICLFISLFGTCFLAFQFWLTTTAKSGVWIESILSLLHCNCLYMWYCNKILTRRLIHAYMQTPIHAHVYFAIVALSRSVACSFAHSIIAASVFIVSVVLMIQIQFGLSCVSKTRWEQEWEKWFRARVREW